MNLKELLKYLVILRARCNNSFDECLKVFMSCVGHKDYNIYIISNYDKCYRQFIHCLQVKCNVYL